MGRLLQVLIPIVFLTAAIAGCIGGDEDTPEPTDGGGDGTNGDGNQTVDPNENETQEPAPVPVPVIDVTASGGNATEGGGFIAPPGTELTFTLDGSGSSVDNGTIDVYVWTVVRPDGSEERGTPGDDPEFTVDVNGTTNTQDYGVYTATLRVLSDQGEIAETTKQWSLSLSNQFSFAGTLLHPSMDDCSGVQEEGQGAIPDPVFGDIVIGTYFTHSMRVGDNATTLNISFAGSTADVADAKLYVYGPETDIESGNCDSAVASSDSGTDLALTVEDLQKGTYGIRVQKTGGLTLEDYTLDLEVLYEVPGDDGDDAGDEEDEEGDEGDGE